MFKRLMAAVTVCATLLLAGCGNDYGVDQHGQKIASERLDKQWKVINYWAEWCGPCRAISPVLEELSTELKGKVKVVKLNVDENPNTTVKYGVRSIPTMILFKGGEAADMKIGAGTPKAGLTKWLESHAA